MVLQETFSFCCQWQKQHNVATTTQNYTWITVGTAAFNDAHKQIRPMTLDSQKPSGFGPRDPEPEKALHWGWGDRRTGEGAIEAVTHSLRGM